MSTELLKIKREFTEVLKEVAKKYRGRFLIRNFDKIADQYAFHERDYKTEIYALREEYVASIKYFEKDKHKIGEFLEGKQKELENILAS